jgi:hypothetical protein
MREPRPSFTPTTAPEPLASWARGAGLAALQTPMGGSWNGLACTTVAHFVRHCPSHWPTEVREASVPAVEPREPKLRS